MSIDELLYTIQEHAKTIDSYQFSYRVRSSCRLFCDETRGGNEKLYVAGLAILFYIICNVFRLFALKNGVGLGKGNIIFAVGSSILATMMGIMLFHEQYTTTQMIGLGLGIIAITLVNVE